MINQQQLWDDDAAKPYDTPSGLDLMARLAGFELESRWADWGRSEFTVECRSHVSVDRLPAR